MKKDQILSRQIEQLLEGLFVVPGKEHLEVVKNLPVLSLNQKEQLHGTLMTIQTKQDLFMKRMIEGSNSFYDTWNHILKDAYKTTIKGYQKNEEHQADEILSELNKT